MRDHLLSDHQRKIVERIMADVEHTHGIGRDVLTGPSRALVVRPARRELAFRLYRHLTLAQVGHVLNRDHTTIMYLCASHRRHRNDVATDAQPAPGGEPDPV